MHFSKRPRFSPPPTVSSMASPSTGLTLLPAALTTEGVRDVTRVDPPPR
jgi:hypothetical protein